MESYFDIVIPVGPNDLEVIEKQIQFTKRNIIGYDKIFLISYDPQLQIEDCITINENIFPFDMNTIIQFHGKNSRNGWYIQQLFKLYAGFCISNIKDIYLVIDSDTFFQKPVSFINDKQQLLYNIGSEFTKSYFVHMQKLHPKLKKNEKVHKKLSGICHHMIFQTKYIQEIFDLVESKHNDKFFNIFLKNVPSECLTSSGASEYEIYFNYVMTFHKDDVSIRNLKWKNTNTLDNISNFDYISYHFYMRKQK